VRSRRCTASDVGAGTPSAGDVDGTGLSVIGASLGGVTALMDIMAAPPGDFAAPILASKRSARLRPSAVPNATERSGGSSTRARGATAATPAMGFTERTLRDAMAGASDEAMESARRSLQER